MTANTYGRQVVEALTNKSGGALAAGDVVIVDTTNNDAVTTTTSASSTTVVGIVQETIANNATGRVLLSGYAALVNVPASVTRGHYCFTHTVAKQATGSASRAAGAFGQFLTGGASPDAHIFGITDSSIAGLTNPMTTTGDIIYSSDNSGTPARRAIGSANTLLHGGTTPAYSAVVPADLDVSADNTTANSTTGHHGLLPKLDSSASKYLDGSGAWSTPSSSSILLAINSYAPGSAASMTQTSGTMGDADATNMAVTATTGTSCIVRLSGTFKASSGATAGDRGLWGVRIGSSTPTGGGPQYMKYVEAVLGGNLLEATSIDFYLTGLTAGSNTFKWGIAGAGAAAMGVYADTNNAAIMTVWSA